MTFKKINTTNCPYYFFNDMINIKNFDPNFLNIDKISFKVLLMLLTTLNMSLIQKCWYLLHWIHHNEKNW